ncbi:hypothetical protein [Actinoplanes sp. NPDC049681]|uniref:hypothetical protein n=1 Tax=Actinoplanes sp. NPDC049681 TaxID=3363905 RepID=UPI0037A8F31A
MAWPPGIASPIRGSGPKLALKDVSWHPEPVVVGPPQADFHPQNNTARLRVTAAGKHRTDLVALGEAVHGRAGERRRRPSASATTGRPG